MGASLAAHLLQNARNEAVILQLWVSRHLEEVAAVCDIRALSRMVKVLRLRARWISSLIKQYQALTGCLLVTFCLNGCYYRTEKLVREMTWSQVQGGTAVRMSFVCAPNQHVVIESTELLAMLQASGKARISVEFEVHHPW